MGGLWGGEGGSKKACEVAAALVCTLSQNGYGDRFGLAWCLRSSHIEFAEAGRGA